MDRCACRIGVHLFEDIRELLVEFILGDKADMRGGYQLGVREQRVIGIR